MWARRGDWRGGEVTRRRDVTAGRLPLERKPVSKASDECTLLAALEDVGDRWSLLIIRASFEGVEHFEALLAHLNIARNILSDRLHRLVSSGILERTIVEEDKRKVRYHLSKKGKDLLPALTALRRWGEKWRQVDGGTGGGRAVSERSSA